MQDVSDNKFIPLKPLKTAVLFLIFNRLDTTKQVFEAIRLARPPRLYIAADGPRDSRPDEDKKVKAVRSYVMDHIDWDCEVKTLFREKNLGCKYAVSSAIDWFFDNEEMGIILEDDCLPSKSFFRFCDELLVRYLNDDHIMQISGFNPLSTYPIDTSYVFSRFGPTWGWATWQRAWKRYDIKMPSWPEKRANLLREEFVQSEAEQKWRQKIFDQVYYNKLDTWDYQWSYTKHLNRGLCIIPRINLVSNVGFRIDATHTQGKAPDYCSFHYALNFPLSHPLTHVDEQKFSDLYLKHYAMPKQQSIFGRLCHRIYSSFKDIYWRRKKWNVILDVKIHPLNKIERAINDDKRFPLVESLDQTSDSFWQWLGKAKSSFLNYKYPHKKALEFFFSAKLLDIRTDDIVLDAAGERSEYLLQIKHNTLCPNLYLNDQIYTDHSVKVDGISVVGGDVTTIGLPDSSVTKIACHHAIEHFRDDKDIKFILEVARLLRKGGKACIIPLFLSDIYAETWNIQSETRYDSRALRIVDKTSSLPGANEDGHFARIYDCQAFMERIHKTADVASLSLKIIECTLDGRMIPDMSINFGSKINCPLRALVLEKV